MVGFNLGWHLARQVQQKERGAKEKRVITMGININDGLCRPNWVGEGKAIEA